LIKFKLKRLLKRPDLVDISLQLFNLSLYRCSLPGDHLILLLLLEHHLLQLLGMIIQLTALILDNLSFFRHLDNGGLNDAYLVIEQPFRLLFLLGKLALQGRHSPLVGDVVSYDRLAHRVERDC
jgi:hypothetical protein